jgi:hypothetical protein
VKTQTTHVPSSRCCLRHRIHPLLTRSRFRRKRKEVEVGDEPEWHRNNVRIAGTEEAKDIQSEGKHSLAIVSDLLPSASSYSLAGRLDTSFQRNIEWKKGYERYKVNQTLYEVSKKHTNSQFTYTN